MTGYIFEDHEDDDLSCLFRSAYPENIASAVNILSIIAS